MNISEFKFPQHPQFQVVIPANVSLFCETIKPSTEVAAQVAIVLEKLLFILLNPDSWLQEGGNTRQTAKGSFDN